MRHSTARIKSWLPLTTVMLFAVIGLSACGGSGAGSGSTPDGGMPTLAYPLPSLTAAAFNALSESERDEAITDMARGNFRDVVSSAATPTGPGSVLNSGVTKSRYNREPDIAENLVLHARYVEDNLDFELTELLEGESITIAALVQEGEVVTTKLISPVPGSTRLKGIEFAGPEGSGLHGIFYSDIEDNDDADYLAIGFWTLTDDENDEDRDRLDIKAVASGNDLFHAGNIEPLAGRATYRGDAAGLFTSKERDVAFRYFNADVRLTADFDDDSIWGIVTDFVDPASNEQIASGELTLEKSDIQIDAASFFRSRSVGVVDGKHFRGEWGGHFFGNGESSADPPGSVAGTFDAAVRDDRSEYLFGVFGAYYDGEPMTGPNDIPTPPDTGDGFASRVVADLNDLSEPVTSGLADRVRVAASRAVVSTTDTTFDDKGVPRNTGVTQSSRNSNTDTGASGEIRENISINAHFQGEDLAFERINQVTESIVRIGDDPDEPGYLATMDLGPELSWKGVEHYYHTGTNGRFRHVLFSDIENKGDTDYLALGYWTWYPDPENPNDTRLPVAGAAASGNDPFQAGNIEPLQGSATYEGNAFGLYAAKETTVAFRAFDAQVGLTADFDRHEIWGVATNGRDTATRARIFEGIALERSYIQTADAAFFEGNVRGVVNDRYVQGRWGGQFFGNGVSSTDLPGSVAGTFGARTRDGTESIMGSFGAYRQ